MQGITEWTFTADVAKWVEQILLDRPDLPFSRTSVEDRGSGSQKRRDFTLYLKNGNAFLTGEMKMPDKPDGGSPYREAVVKDAHDKADDAGVEYYFTWNVNRCVLWKTFEVGKPIISRHIEDYSNVLFAPIKHSSEVAHPRVQEQIKKFLLRFLERCAALMSGEKPMMMLTPDEKFLNIWEAALQQPVAQTLAALSQRYEKDNLFTAELDSWMREDQGWIISHSDEEVIRENLERAAKLSCYVLAGKIIFYKALRRKFTHLQELEIPETTTTGAGLLLLLDGCFQAAMEATGDYETVFQSDYGSTLPFLGNEVVDGWRDLSLDTDGFDFTQIDYEIIGQIFERMLSVEERHKYGQHYTRSEVVDLINAFCIRIPDAKVMDPSCGGGTFLVRAYTRLKQLSGGTRTHDDLIRQLFGLDISSFPAYLTTINLATRDLVDRANYPRVANRDFFLTNCGDQLFHVPLGKDRDAMEMLDKVDAVVGNPPYVHHTKINGYYGSTYKKQLQQLVEREVPNIKFSGRSDLHCYFFPHALTFLNDGGYMGLLVSSPWLDTGYGFPLQKFLLDNFQIIAIIESSCEPWFTGARVTTSAVILRQQSNSQERQENLVKFVRLDVPLSQIINSEATDGRLTPDAFRERLEAVRGKEEFTLCPLNGEPVQLRQETTRGMNVRVIRQGDLERLGNQSIKVQEDDDYEEGDEADVNAGWHSELGSDHSDEYTGYKWGIFLHAPDIFFKLLRRGGPSFVPLGHISEIKRGVTSGCDKFFFPKDITNKMLNEVTDDWDFKQRFGVTKNQTVSVRIVEAGDGSVHLIESQYIEPLVFNLMEVDSAVVNTSLLKKHILLVSKKKEDIPHKHVLEYIKWGEQEGFASGETCRSRTLWYDIRRERRGEIIWTKTQRYRHLIARNTADLHCNCNLYDVWSHEDVDVDVLCAILNSTITALNKQLFGRMLGGDPITIVENKDARLMLVPDPRHVSSSLRLRLRQALSNLQKRPIHHLVDVDGAEKGWTGDLAKQDRQELDDAVLELIGITDATERQTLRAELYSAVTTMYRSIRIAEKDMQKKRANSARQGRASAHSIAAEVWESIDPKPQVKTPLNFARSQDNQLLDLPEGKAKILAANLLETAAVSIGGWAKDMKDLARAKFVKAVSDEGIVGPVEIPNDPEVCKQGVEKYEKHCREVDERLASLAALHTADEKMQERVIRELKRRMHQPVAF
jgi:type I restriction-modification system DNA methylase subunit